MDSSRVSARRWRFWGRTFERREARLVIWRAVSSPEMKKTGLVLAMAREIWRARVDFPTPGSPDKRKTPPGVSPPPRTRSSSEMEVGMGWICFWEEREETEVKMALGAEGRREECLEDWMTSDFWKVFQAEQLGHFPSQVGEMVWQVEQVKMDFGLAMVWVWNWRFLVRDALVGFRD